MSRVGKQPVSIPKGVDVMIEDKQITVKGKIKDVGEVFGYSVDIDEISKGSK